MSPKKLTLIVIALVLLACRGTGEQVAGPIPRAQGQECPGLEDRLYRMVKAEDPAGLAREERIYYRDGLVRVSMELRSPEAPLPSGYQLQIEGRVQETVQALVPLGELCSLSREPQVRSITVPSEFRPREG